jgi:flagellar assembly protein FliH
MSDKVVISMKSKARAEVKEISSASAEDEENDALKQSLAKQYELGYKTGYSTAMSELEKEYQLKISAKIRDFHNLIGKLNQKITEQESEFESLVMNISLLFAERILKREISAGTIINAQIKSALKKIAGAGNIQIRLNPEDIRCLNNETKTFLADNTISKIQVEADEKIEQGGCFIETEIGNVDARISTAVSELRKLIEARSDNL